jgi:hypothetical protein
VAAVVAGDTWVAVSVVVAGTLAVSVAAGMAAVVVGIGEVVR